MSDLTSTQLQYRSYLLSHRWREKKQEVRDRVISEDGVLHCEDCGEFSNQYEFHHDIYPNRKMGWGNEPSAWIVCLCPRCHEKEHFGS